MLNKFVIKGTLRVATGMHIGSGGTFAVIGATIADNFEVKMPEGTIGSSLLDELK